MTEEKRRFPLAFARIVANQLLKRLGPHCQRIEVAGSIRRGKPMVGDIELLSIPRVNDQGDLLDRKLQMLIKAGSLEYRLNRNGHRAGYGPLNKLLVHVGTGMPLDVFTATEENWGMAMFVRTGSAEWNRKAMSRLLYRGMRGHAYGGITWKTERYNCPDEETVFRYLQWPYVPPEGRS